MKLNHIMFECDTFVCQFHASYHGESTPDDSAGHYEQ